MKSTAKGGRLAARRAVSNNLPHYLNSFVGRKSELPALKTLLARGRLVTLIGPGGAGKSRLAAEVSRATLDLWPDGAWWVDLAPISDPRQVAGAVASALELTGRGPAEDVVTAWLAAKRALLVLDSCEHLAAACAAFCQAALERCPELTILATSREVLGVPGEAQWRVSSLQASDAVPLFEARAALVRPDFKVSARNLDAVTQICDRVDRLPLAIELAASRVGMLTEGEILHQLSDRFHLLGGGTRTNPERQQTMRATIDWSYRLLTEDEAILFRRLSAFRGGFTLESVKAVCGADVSGTVLDLLSGLVQKSMVLADQAEGEGTRYRLLESQLAYAEDELQQSGEIELLRRSHYEHFRARLSARTISWFGSRALTEPPPGVAGVEWKARELGNLWAAMEWAQHNADDLGLSLAVDMTQMELVDFTQMRRLLADLLTRAPVQGVPRVWAYITAAWLAHLQGDYVEADKLAQTSVPLARRIRDAEVLAFALYQSSATLVALGKVEAARESIEEAAGLVEGSANSRLVSVIKSCVALVATQSGDYAAAFAIQAEAIALARAEGVEMNVAACLDNLAWAQLGMKDQGAAAISWKEALLTFRTLNDFVGLMYCLEGLSCVASARGDHQRALRLAAAVTRGSAERSLSFEPWIRAQFDENVHLSRSRLGVRKSEDAWNQGWVMTIDQAVDYALSNVEPKSLPHANPLSRREHEVVTLVAQGMTNRQIAERLFIAERSAEGHLERIRNKLGVRSRTEVATWAVEHGLREAPIQEKGTRRGSPSS